MKKTKKKGKYTYKDDGSTCPHCRGTIKANFGGYWCDKCGSPEEAYDLEHVWQWITTHFEPKGEVEKKWEAHIRRLAKNKEGK